MAVRHQIVIIKVFNLTPEEIQAIEVAIPETEVKGKGMRNFVFTDGIMSLKK